MNNKEPYSREPFDSVNFSNSYGNNQYRYTNQHNNHQGQNYNYAQPLSKRPSHPSQTKKTLSRPKPSLAKRFKDNSQKIIASLLIAGTVIGGTAFAANTLNEHIETSQIAKTFNDSLEATYESSEFLQVSFTEENYVDYGKHIIKDTLKEEDSLKDYLKQEDLNKTVWLYLLSGEGDRLSISNEDILTSLSNYSSHSEKVSFDKETGMPDKLVSYFAQLSQICTSEENKKDLIALLDAVVGASSLSNSKEALSYNHNLLSTINTNSTITDLEYAININNNFEYFFEKNENLYMQPYFDRINNIKTNAKNIVSGKTLTNVRNPELLASLVKSTSKYELVDSYQAASNTTFLSKYDTKIAEFHRPYAQTRNELYQLAIDAQKNPQEINPRIENTLSNIDTRLQAYDLYNEKGPQILEDLHSLFTSLEKGKQEVNKAEKGIRETSFDDFSR